MRKRASEISAKRVSVQRFLFVNSKDWTGDFVEEVEVVMMENEGMMAQ
jgi:hypothetical protein